MLLDSWYFEQIIFRWSAVNLVSSLTSSEQIELIFSFDEFYILTCRGQILKNMSFTSGPFAAQAQRILEQEQEATGKNTKIAYDHKAKEFISFCHIMYASHDVPTTVTEEKVF